MILEGDWVYVWPCGDKQTFKNRNINGNHYDNDSIDSHHLSSTYMYTLLYMHGFCNPVAPCEVDTLITPTSAKFIVQRLELVNGPAGW